MLITSFLLPISCKSENVPFNLTKKEYQKLVESTLVSTGNNYRLKTVLQKIKKGQEVHIAALGGSVTEGAGPEKFTDGYAYQFFRALKELAPKDSKNLYFNGAGLSGTPSLLGLLRYQKDVVDVCGKAPDLLIIEFAVNDGAEAVYERSFEALVRTALTQSSETAVIALYSAATYGNSSAQKMPIANYYEIPQINVLPAVNSAIKNKQFAENAYYTDTVHPTKEGHAFMKDCLMHLIKTVNKAKKDKMLSVKPANLKNPSLADLRMIKQDDKAVKIDAGDFCKIDKDCQIIKKTNKSNFPHNWKKDATNTNNAPFKISVNCKALVLSYKVQASYMSEKFGVADVFVDGKKFASYDGAKAGGWNHCETVLIIDEKIARNHTVEVKMQEGFEDKGFTIVAIGIVE